VFFLAADENKSLDLRVVKVGDVNVQTTVDPAPLPPEDPFTIVLLVYAGSVSDQGALQAIPRPSVQLQIVLGAGLALQGADRTLTDSGGRASFHARCVGRGQQGADVVVAAATRLPLTLPPCPG
jgi:hypothetical protein